MVMPDFTAQVVLNMPHTFKNENWNIVYNIMSPKTH